VTLVGRASGAPASLASNEGAPGAFFSRRAWRLCWRHRGSAPFLGVALGYRHLQRSCGIWDAVDGRSGVWPRPLCRGLSAGRDWLEVFAEAGVAGVGACGWNRFKKAMGSDDSRRVVWLSNDARPFTRSDGVFGSSGFWSRFPSAWIWGDVCSAPETGAGRDVSEPFGHRHVSWPGAHADLTGVETLESRGGLPRPAQKVRPSWSILRLIGSHLQSTCEPASTQNPSRENREINRHYTGGRFSEPRTKPSARVGKIRPGPPCRCVWLIPETPKHRPSVLAGRLTSRRDCFDALDKALQ